MLQDRLGALVATPMMVSMSSAFIDTNMNTLQLFQTDSRRDFNRGKQWTRSRMSSFNESIDVELKDYIAG